MDVAGEMKKVSIGIDKSGFIVRFKETADAVVGTVEVGGISS